MLNLTVSSVQAVSGWSQKAVQSLQWATGAAAPAGASTPAAAAATGAGAEEGIPPGQAGSSPSGSPNPSNGKRDEAAAAAAAAAAAIALDEDVRDLTLEVLSSSVVLTEGQIGSLHSMLPFAEQVS